MKLGRRVYTKTWRLPEVKILTSRRGIKETGHVHIRKLWSRSAQEIYIFLDAILISIGPNATKWLHSMKCMKFHLMLVAKILDQIRWEEWCITHITSFFAYSINAYSEKTYIKVLVCFCNVIILSLLQFFSPKMHFEFLLSIIILWCFLNTCWNNFFPG